MQSLPAALSELTQSDYNFSWRCWVTFCIMGVPARAFPADKRLLKAFVAQLLLCQYAPATIGKILSAIISRHSTFGHPSPWPFLFKELGNWVKGLKKNVSTKSAVKLPLTSFHLQTLARLPTATVKEERSTYMVLVSTVGACLQSEVLKLDICLTGWSAGTCLWRWRNRQSVQWLLNSCFRQVLMALDSHLNLWEKVQPTGD